MDNESLGSVDLVVGIDVRDYEKQLTASTAPTARVKLLVKPDCDFVEIGFAEINISKWSMDYCRMQPCSIRALGDTTLGVPELTRLCKEQIAKDPKLQAKIKERNAKIGKRHDEVWASGRRTRAKDWDARPMTWRAWRSKCGMSIKNEDWVLAANNLKHRRAQALGLRQALPASGRRTRHLDADRHVDRRRARAQGAQAHRGGHPARRRPDVRCRRALVRGQERNPDADRDAQQPRLLQRLGAPDPHGAAARHRGAKAHIGMDLFGPEPDFGALARSMGCGAKARSTIPRTLARRSSARWRWSSPASRPCSMSSPSANGER